MGTWGAGLYASDLADDLRSTLRAVTRLPFDEARLVQMLRESEPGAADDPANEDYTVFWLVLADQFEKRGIASAAVVATALAIIDDGTDIARFRELGLREADLRKRAKALAELRARLVAAAPISRRRAVLRAPQPYTLELGGLYTYPTKAGAPINPYMGPKWFDRAAWMPDGYGVMWSWNRSGNLPSTPKRCGRDSRLARGGRRGVGTAVSTPSRPSQSWVRCPSRPRLRTASPVGG